MSNFFRTIPTNAYGPVLLYRGIDRQQGDHYIYVICEPKNAPRVEVQIPLCCQVHQREAWETIDRAYIEEIVKNAVLAHAMSGKDSATVQ